MANSLKGSHLGGYTLHRLMARGGMGEVYEATENRLQRRVALKIIAPSNPHEHDHDELIARFMQEARTLAQINHPNVVTIYSIDSVGGVPFIAMEYIEGVSFRELLEEFTFSSDGALPLFVQMLEGLECLHNNRIIHRDLKPHNILLRPDSAVKILDFGIAKAQGGDTQNDLTKAGIVVGTLPYMPPEVKTGVSASQRSDIWSLGAIFYECLTGVRLIQAQADFNVNQDVPFTADFKKKIPSELRAIITKMCAARPAERYANCAEVIEALKRFQYSRPPVSSQIWQNLSKKVEEVAAAKRKEAAENPVSTRILQMAEVSSPSTSQRRGEIPIREITAKRESTNRPLPKKLNAKSLGKLPWVAGGLLAAALIYAIAAEHNVTENGGGNLITKVSTTVNPPPPVDVPLRLTEPGDNKTMWLDPASIPTLAWSRAIPAGEYDIQISLEPSFQRALVQEPISGVSFRPARVLSEGKYYWRLWPHGTERSPVGPQQFTISHLSPVVLVSPDADHIYDEAGIRTAGITFAWACKPGAARYRLQVSRDEHFTSTSIDTALNGCSIKGQHLPKGDHYWRVRMEDVPGAQAMWSEARTVTVDQPEIATTADSDSDSDDDDSDTAPATSPKPKVHTPLHLTEPQLKNDKFGLVLNYVRKPRDIASLSTSVDQLPTLEWHPVKGAKSYLMQLSSSKDFDHLLTEERVNAPTFKWKTVVPGRTYWRVAALGAGPRERSNFSKSGLMDVFLPVPAITNSYKFEVAAKKNPDPVVIDWPPIPLAEKYIVQIGTERDLASAQERVTTVPQVPLDGVSGRYFMRVAAADQGGQPISSFSNLAMVDVSAARGLEDPKLIKPPIGAHAPIRSGRISIFFEWSKVDAADSYALEVASDPNFKNLLDHRTTKDRGSIMKQAAFKGRVYWRVRALSGQGNSPWSRPSYFDVK